MSHHYEEGNEDEDTVPTSFMHRQVNARDERIAQLEEQLAQAERDLAFVRARLETLRRERTR